MMVVIEIQGLHTVSEANTRDHHMARARRKREHTDTARAHVLSRMARHAPWSTPIQVTLTRIGAKRLDTDNLAGSLKGVQDGVALALGIDDGDPRIAWRYQQECRRKLHGVQPYGVRIEIAAGDR